MTPSSTEGFSEFCNQQPFWDTNLTWNNDYPAFTPCFSDTILTLFPCAWLWSFGLIYVATICTRQGASLEIGFLNIIKTVLGLLLIAVITTRTTRAGLHYTNNSESPLKADVICPSIRIATMVFFVTLTHIQRNRGVVTSGVMFFFWVFEVLCGVVPFYTAFMEKTYDTDILHFSLLVADYILVMTLFILICFAENLPKDPTTERARCPDSEASVLSLLTFFWLTPLIFLGYRKELEDKDFWDIPEGGKCETISFTVRQAWQKELYHSRLVKSPNINSGRDSLIMDRPLLPNQIVTHLNENGLMNEIDDDRTHLIQNGRSRKASNSSSVHSDDEKEGPKKVTASLVRCTLRVFAWELFKAHFLQLFNLLIAFIFPLLLQQLIKFVDSPISDTRDTWKGYLYGVLYFTAAIIQAVLTEQVWYRGYVIGLNVESSLSSLVYRKVLSVDASGGSKFSSGTINNLMTIDTERLADLLKLLWCLWSCPLQFLLAMVYLYFTLGPSVFAGLAVIIVIMPVNAFIMKYYNKYEDRLMRLKDKRIKLTNEVLTGMKVLKLYAWEPSFQDKIQEIRDLELRNLRKIYVIITLATFTWTLAPFLMSLVTFVTYVNVVPSHHLTPSVAFTANILFGILQFSVNMFPMLLSDLVRVKVSVARLSNFLCHEDLDPDNVTRGSTGDTAISIANGTFQHNKETDPVLTEINVTVPRGSLVMIVGPVGCGKSSLLSAILGNMVKTHGSVHCQGSLAYVPQEAWIQNNTLRGNILFTKDLHEEKYQQVLDACALRQDLSILAAADETEIGEKGINLSGGQKQRVSLARAVYNDADIYLLDDPLSAVDAHVGKHIFEYVMSQNGILNNKTRVMVTNGVHWLPRADTIIVISNNRISETGSYDQLLEHDGAFAKFLRTYLKEHQMSSDSDTEEDVAREKILERLVSIQSDTHEDYEASVEGTSACPNIFTDRICKTSESDMELPEVSLLSPPGLFSLDGPRKRTGSRLSRHSSVVEYASDDSHVDSGKGREKPSKHGALTEEEEVASGKVKWSVYITYARAAGIRLCFSVIICFILYQVSNMVASIWLQQWTDNDELANVSLLANSTVRRDLNDVYAGVYGSLGIVQVIFIMAYGMITASAAVRASTSLHNNMLASILKAPMSFFDTTPNGRIINRFTQDLEKIDEYLPELLMNWIMSIFGIIVNIMVISYSLPIFLTIVLPAFILFFIIQKFYVTTSRQMRRLGSKAESPVYNHLSESLTGASVIRAYGEQGRFIRECQRRIDTHQIYSYAYEGSSRWLGFLLSTLGNIGVLAAAMFAASSRGYITGGLVGLAVQFSLQITESLAWFVEITSEVESDIVAVERIKNYTDIQHEADWIKPYRKMTHDWPRQGRIEFTNYTTRYRPELDLVLRGVSFTIQPGMKVGIVGRTGAGKSSLTLALFRVIEPVSGSIHIDDIDISDIGLHDLRARLTILPQDPVIFSGTLRMNLDPFNQYIDADLWNALDHAHLRSFVDGLSEGLDHECGEGGQNMSVGQRQLLCLARALLKDTKILVLDEATAAIDMETDVLIQETIRQEFSGCTVLTIAHRLHSIMDYDQILVLDNGLVAQYDTPANLLTDKNGIFYTLASSAGIVT